MRIFNGAASAFIVILGTGATALADAGADAKAADPRKEITIASVPDAECQLYSVATGSAGTPVFADDLGVVHLFAEPTLTSDRYFVECSENGQQVSHDFDLSNASTFEPAKVAVASTRRVTRPGLSDPMALSAAEIRAVGYPPRPDPGTPLFKRWLEIVTHPIDVIEPRSVKTDRHYAPETGITSQAWDGMAMSGRGRLSLAVGTFSVPSFSSTGNGSGASIWTGLDGVGTNDVVQAGIDYIVTNNVGSYRTWYEYFTATLNYTTLTVTPYDSVDFWVWEGDASCNYGTNLKGYGCYWYENKSRGTTNGTFVLAKPGSAATFTGATAEGVIERIGSSYLASWGTNSTFIALDAYDWAWGYHDITAGADWNVELVNSGGTTLATADDFGGANTIRFNFVQSH